MTYSIGFILEQALGHITHSQNLMRVLSDDPTIHAQWGLPAFEVTGLGRRMPLYRSNWTVRAGWQAQRMVSEMQRNEALDGLFFHTQVTATLAQNWLNRIPGVVSLDATPIQYDALGITYAHKTGPAWLENLKFRLNQGCFQKARHIVTWSAWARSGLVEYGVPLEKVTVIPPGVTIADWTRPSSRPSHTGVRILFVGGDMERKGGSVLLEAFRRLRSNPEITTSNVELHIVTRSAVGTEPGVFVYNQMQPNSAELKQLYFESDIFCLPTLGDCLPMALAEAGAVGLPLVSTQVGAIAEIVHDGATGLLTPPGEPEPLAAALARLVRDENLRMTMGGQARRLIARDHDAEANASRLVSLLKATVDESPRKPSPR